MKKGVVGLNIQPSTFVKKGAEHITNKNVSIVHGCPTRTIIFYVGTVK